MVLLSDIIWKFLDQFRDNYSYPLPGLPNEETKATLTRIGNDKQEFALQLPVESLILPMHCCLLPKVKLG